ncbi:MAG: YbbR-like domain-containing protein [Coprococcus sp.]
MIKKLTHNFSLKILSLALAVLVWLVVLSIEDPIDSANILDISVTEINGDQITEAGKAYSYVGGNTVNVKIKGKTSIVNKVNKNDFLAVADMSKLSITGAVTVDVSCPKYPSLEITPIGSSTVLQIEIEDLIEKSLNVKVLTNDDAASGYYIGQGVATPNMVTISGPKSEVDKVNEAVVRVNVTSANTTDVTTNAALELLDKNGDVISSSTLTISQSSIDVRIPIYPTKTVPVNFGITGQVADGYRMVSAVYEPKEVIVAGRREDLAKIDAITLRDYDISGMTGKIEDSLSISQNLAEALPDGVVLKDKEATVALVVDIQEVVEETFELPLSKISLRGSSMGYSYVKSGIRSSDKTISLTVSGISDEVKELTTDELTALVDVTGYAEGEYDLPVTVIFDNNLEMAGTAYVHVAISKTGDE